MKKSELRKIIRETLKEIDLKEQALGSAMGSATGSAAGCDSLAWSNYSNWQSTWTNNTAFNSSNPNQPCNHICQKTQQWTNMGSGIIPLPPVQDNIVQCKLAVGQNQSQIHGCNC